MIEGRQVTVASGTSMREAAKAAGVLIPHYCYHPELPVRGLPDVSRRGGEGSKARAGVRTAVAEGQFIHVHSDKALDSAKGVLEMLLINHPLDCPICDQAGECELQDYTFRNAGAKVGIASPSAAPVEDFGGDVVYVANRCHSVHAMRPVHGRRGARSGPELTNAAIEPSSASSKERT